MDTMADITITVNVSEAKTHLSRLLQRVAAGERIAITKAGKPVALLVPFVERPQSRVSGVDKGKGIVPGDDWDDPIPGFTEYFE